MSCKIITLETPREVEIARHHWNKGWNDMLKVLPKVLRDSVLLSRDEALAEALARLEAKQLQPELAEIQRKQLEERFENADEKHVPWNREHTEEKKPLVVYYGEGMRKYWTHPVWVEHLKQRAAERMSKPLTPDEMNSENPNKPPYLLLIVIAILFLGMMYALIFKGAFL